ncbi:DNA-directed RNA polymerases I and III subunit RPAC1 [Tetranychus urticae]|uniref:DNA-directed RNA polymerases I and III subunit RPAC1 n=1 Tax=Tetranychus urticae TaxID=32264 RepID=T1KCG6_TETUR|nr:DNA-directed RNA polymerases I and III subunit RPAC1 [Tetranychus urticae]
MTHVNLNDGRYTATLFKSHIENNDTSECDDDEQWTIEIFERDLDITIVKNDENLMEIEFLNIDAPIVNAFRRIIMSEIPTMAIEKVFIGENTTIFQDDFLAHRLGLIPIKADPRLFEYRDENDMEGTPQDTIELSLKIKCVKNPEASKETGVTDLYLNRNVYSKSIKWVPLGNQSSFIKETIKPVNDDILIAKISPGQALDLKLHCVKGIGRDHAKFSPVATVYYRLHPAIEITRPIHGEDAKLLQSCFSKGVIEVKKDRSGKETAVVANARDDSLSRNYYMYKKFEDAIKMGLKKNHFIFYIESTGILSSESIFNESVEILISKCRNLLREVQELKES